MTNGAATGVTGPKGPWVHLLVPTHTTRHLDTCLASLLAQTDPPETVTVTCDVDTPEISDLLAQIWPRVVAAMRSAGRSAPALHHVARPHQGEPRLNQVRNNGLRSILNHGGGPEDLVVTIDGDMLLAPGAIASHRAFARSGHDVIVPFRINLSEERTRAINSRLFLDAGADGTQVLIPDDVQACTLNERDRRYRRQLWQRRVLPWLSKPHKPKLLGGHHAVRLGVLEQLNGYDEEYIGYGYDDDDLARRLHQLGGLRWAIAVTSIPAFHLWHPTRAPTRPTDAPGYARFSRADLPARAGHGIVDPIAQPDPVWRLVEGPSHLSAVT